MRFVEMNEMDKLMLKTLLLLLLGTECGAQPEVCGLAQLNSRIVGGQAASQGDWPWQVSLHVSPRGHFCGATLINSEWLLSAAHCFFSTRPVRAFLGRQSQQGSNANEVSRDIVETIRHPDYDPTTFDNDIVLLRLSSPVTFNNFIAPVCLAASGSTFFTGTDSWVTGWGNIGSGVPLPFPENLMEVEVPVVGNSQCNCDYDATITDNMICAGLREGGKDACQGDSGGPMVSKQGARWVQSGVVSFGEGCARPNLPGVYTRVSRYQDWISGHIGSDNLPGFVTFTSSGTDPDLQVSCGDQTPISTTPPLISTSTDALTEVFCGNAPLNERLSGSGSATAGDWPWAARLHLNGSLVCSGTLVSVDTVLTSAQCTAQSDAVSEWTVFLGQSGSETAVNVITITTSTRSGPNVAVLRLASPPPLSNFIQPICMASGQIFATGSICWAAGWSMSQGGEVLEEVQTPLLDCGNGTSTDSICTELTIDQENTGGALMCQLGSFWYQAAVLDTTNASRAGREDQMIVLPNLSVFNNFLRQAVGDFLSPTTSSSAPPSHLSELLLVGVGLHVVLMAICN
ncbi:serine protease 27 [Syngnathus scovelli]|uniref:serine protease 27 n=1 Tax=Syngnathus scovelli TaxID=161590 RepID=UPI00211093A2|nr:prostasin [Syngnathus scovelli]